MNHDSNRLRSALLQRLMWARNDIGFATAGQVTAVIRRGGYPALDDSGYGPCDIDFDDRRRIAAAPRQDPAGSGPARRLRRGMPGSGRAPALFAQARRDLVERRAVVAGRHIAACSGGIELITDASLRHRAAR